MNIRSFEVLTVLAGRSDLTQREIAQEARMSLGSVSSTLAELRADGFVEQGANKVTDAGRAALEPYRVQNAIILAAGLSSRFVPISYEKPKGILTVRGEVLIERQIRQLKEAGIDDITVVVGYKKEYFFYLEDEFDVKLVVNEDYATRNNHSSLMAVRELLGRTYICSSDDYFTENPFRPYELKASYAAQYADGPTEEWCMEVGAKGRIKSVTIGGDHAWYMIGHAFFDEAFSARFVEILEAEYALPQTLPKLWEELYVDHIKDFDMVIRTFDADSIWEFDSIDDLREFDPLFIENVDSEAFENISKVLGCSRSEIRDIYPLKQGLTNLSCHFAIDAGEYVYRHPGIGTERLIDRAAEVVAQQVAKDLGIDDTFIFEDPDTGWKISRFIPDCRQLDPHDDAQLARAMQMAAKLHAETVEMDRTFDFFEESKKYEQALLAKGPIDVPGYAQMAEKVARLHDIIKAEGGKRCLTHNDFFYLNLLLDADDELYLIDWEYAGMADPANDLGTFTVTCELSEEEAERALEHYLGRPPTFEEKRHCFAFIAFAGWCWYVWSLVKESEGDCVGEWLYIYYNYSKAYLAKVLDWYEGDSSEVARSESDAVEKGSSR